MSYKVFQKNTSSSKVDPLIYEVKMFNDAFEQYLLVSKENIILRTLVLESFLLHARILIDFLEGKGSFKDDLTCSDFIDGSGKAIQGQTVNLKSDIKKVMNKHLTHMTKKRLTEKPVWDITDIKYTINGAMQNFIKKCADSNFSDNLADNWRSAFSEQLGR